MAEIQHPNGQVAIVTGSSSGIGKAIAERLAQRGFSVVFNGHQTADAGERLAHAHERAIYVDADVSTTAGAARLIDKALTAYGHLDLLVNNAGIARQIPHRDLDAVDDAFWDRIMAVNLKGPWNMVKAARKSLMASHGLIINTASVAGITPSGSSIPYAVSKAGVIHLTRLLAKALAPEIRVNAVAPGYIDTPLTHDWEPLRDFVMANAPLQRLGQAIDVADAVEGLTMMRYVTGAIVPVTGGLELL